MKPKKRQKLCYNCDGDVDLDVIVCPFCAADLRTEKIDQMQKKFSQSARPMQGLGESLYPPSHPQHIALSVDSAKETPAEVFSDEGEKAQPLWASILIATGSQLFVLGLLLAVFSHHGIVNLQWDARLWFLYLFASVPFLVFGYRSLSRS